MKVLLSLCIALLCSPLSLLRSAQEDLLFYPPVIEVVRDSTGYVQQMVVFSSVTGDSIRLTKIDGSCRCATGTVQRELAHDSVQGKVYLAVNAKHFVDSLNYVDYTIHHTGPHSPQMFRVIVHLKEKP